MISISARYLAAEFAISFLVAFAFFFFMFFINQLLLLAEDILQKDVPLWDVMLLIFFSLPSIIALSVPFATLVGTLMAVGRLSSDNEMVAMRATGFPMRRVFVPFAALALVLSGASFFVNDYLLPLGTLNFGRLYRELLYANPALELEPYSVKRYQDDILITGAVGPGQLEDFVVLDTDDQGHRRVIVADQARLLREGDPNVITLELDEVTSHVSVSANEHNWSTAAMMRYNILLQDITIALRSPGPREMSARDVRREIAVKARQLAPRTRIWREQVQLRSIESVAAAIARDTGRVPQRPSAEIAADAVRLLQQEPEDRSLRVYRLEYHKKFSIPFAALSFVVLAFPLGLYSRRSGRGVGFGIGLLIAFGYWAMLIGGQTFGTQRPNVPPALAMWAPNVLFLALGLIAYFRKARQ